MRRLSISFASLLFGLMLAGAASAQDARQNEPGKFDFYVLSLSWSPSFCEQAGDRKSAQQQCGERQHQGENERQSGDRRGDRELLGDQRSDVLLGLERGPEVAVDGTAEPAAVANHDRIV